MMILYDNRDDREFDSRREHVSFFFLFLFLFSPPSLPTSIFDLLEYLTIFYF